MSKARPDLLVCVTDEWTPCERISGIFAQLSTIEWSIQFDIGVYIGLTFRQGTGLIEMRGPALEDYRTHDQPFEYRLTSKGALAKAELFAQDPTLEIILRHAYEAIECRMMSAAEAPWG